MMVSPKPPATQEDCRSAGDQSGACWIMFWKSNCRRAHHLMGESSGRQRVFLYLKQPSKPPPGGLPALAARAGCAKTGTAASCAPTCSSGWLPEGRPALQSNVWVLHARLLPEYMVCPTGHP